ncbi:MAG: DNA polymerase IV [Lachnospiraceae bacterium]|nr:DNA polymerase IV [Lachnospiraceae bacterium]
MEQRLIFHIDVNSAYLSWAAVEKLKNGSTFDLRSVPSIIGGDMSNRHGVVLAKSIPAKAFHIITGEPVAHALKKCPHLLLEPPDHRLYGAYSRRLMELLHTFCQNIEQVSIDECYMDVSGKPSYRQDPTAAAALIKDTVRDTLGFTVNVGISSNKLLAKMASDFQKPDKVHTLFPEEIPSKMWPLPVKELFMVGRASASTLEKLEIRTIGDLAHMDLHILESHMKSHGRLIWEFANGIDDSPVQTEEGELKGVGNSTTLSRDAETTAEARKVLFSLCQQVSSRLKRSGYLAGMLSTEIRYASFVRVSHQKQLPSVTDDADVLYRHACLLFDELWNREPIRLLGVRTSKLATEPEPVQMTLFDLPRTQKEIQAENAAKSLQEKFGKSIIRKGL